MDLDVVIVGAGIAGLSCALTLQKNNLSFAILEAGEEPGGRIQTDSKDGFRLDPEIKASSRVLQYIFRVFAADWRPPFRDPFLVLNGDGRGPINNIAFPNQEPPTPNPYVLPAPLAENLRACGEHQSLPGIQWALLSGRKTAEVIVEELN